MKKKNKLKVRSNIKFDRILVYLLIAIFERGYVRKMELLRMGLQAKVCLGMAF